MNECLEFWSCVERDTIAPLQVFTLLSVAGGIAVLMLLYALRRLKEYTAPGIFLISISLGSAVALLLPSALIAWKPEEMLGLRPMALNPATISTATLQATVQALNQVLWMGVIGSGALMIGMLTTFGLLGFKRLEPARPELRPLHGELPLTHVVPNQAGGVRYSTEDTHTPRVKVLSAPNSIEEIHSIDTRLMIGRDASRCRLVIEDHTVSKLHASIEQDGRSYVIYDFSRNGTFVNGTRIPSNSAVPLNDGDEIEIGAARVQFIAPDGEKTVILQGVADAALIPIDESGRAHRQPIPIKYYDTRIGRDNRNDVVLTSQSVSRHHAVVQFDGTNFYLIDTNENAHQPKQSNGTWLDERRITGRVPLRDGQVIRVGDQRLRFERQEVADDTQR